MEHADHLSDAEKRRLVRDGFVILRNAMPRDLSQRAKRVITENPQTIVHGDAAAVNGLYNDSILATVLEEAMGPHTRPINAQVAVTMPHYADAVVRTRVDVNNVYAPSAHVDGGWAGLCPVKQSESLAAGQSLHTWGTDGDPKVFAECDSDLRVVGFTLHPRRAEGAHVRRGHRAAGQARAAAHHRVDRLKADG